MIYMKRFKTVIFFLLPIISIVCMLLFQISYNSYLIYAGSTYNYDLATMILYKICLAVCFFVSFKFYIDLCKSVINKIHILGSIQIILIVILCLVLSYDDVLFSNIFEILDLISLWILCIAYKIMTHFVHR